MTSVFVQVSSPLLPSGLAWKVAAFCSHTSATTPDGRHLCDVGELLDHDRHASREGPFDHIVVRRSIRPDVKPDGAFSDVFRRSRDIPSRATGRRHMPATDDENRASSATRSLHANRT